LIGVTSTTKTQTATPAALEYDGSKSKNANNASNTPLTTTIADRKGIKGGIIAAISSRLTKWPRAVKANTMAIPIRPAVLALVPYNLAAPDAPMRSSRMRTTFFIFANVNVARPWELAHRVQHLELDPEVSFRNSWEHEVWPTWSARVVRLGSVKRRTPSAGKRAATQ
jgi:hypothetical protein